eukprot:TRINITY_DN14452_c0_g1_i1.p1 TRINITY_DN14452_c0_g1~~TRINITY_DN14452_c0_g1_i1.p1  ORF type:complete len:847 (-),score=139.88 TRINITY_DN14452_c0_g1_i1:171-2711(-)
MTAESDSVCPLCSHPLTKWWPFIRVPLRSEDGEGSGKTSVRLCHLECAIHVAWHGEGGQLPSWLTEYSSKKPIEELFSQEIRGLSQRCPQLKRKNAALRISLEEDRLAEAGASGKWPHWPHPSLPSMPVAAFFLDRLIECRISSLPSLRQLPPDFGQMSWVRTLVIMSCGLEALPPEMGQMHDVQHLFLNGNFLRTLPEEVCALPNLTEVCLDANLIEELPPLLSPHLTLFTAPANRLKKDLVIASGKLTRLEAHGNYLTSLASALPSPPQSLSSPQSSFANLISLKVMGNRLRELPQQVGEMKALRVCVLSKNSLESIPAGFAEMPILEWLFVYDNCLRQLPSHLLLGSKNLERLLLEGNPLEPSAIMELVDDAQSTRANTLGLDFDQVSRTVAACANTWKAIPTCVSVGTPVHVDGSGQYTVKLLRASQLRRAAGSPALGEKDAPPGPEESPADLLVVAFSASQGEPEWLGFCRRLYSDKVVQAQPKIAGTLDEILQGASQFDESVARLWSGCPVGPANAASSQEVPESERKPVELNDFDVLSLVDHRMRWYHEDYSSLQKALKSVTSRYKHVLFVGASMGGFGALLHCGDLADAVVALSPQSSFLEACLRPPAESSEAHIELSEKMFASIGQAFKRGSKIAVHCAADEHLIHALSMPLEQVSIVVHPLCPRKPFARVMDRAKILMPILKDAVCELLCRQRTSDVVMEDLPALKADTEKVPKEKLKVTVGCWQRNGTLMRYTAEAGMLLKLLFGPGSHDLPRAGDWFCKTCFGRNMSEKWFCTGCGTQETFGAPISTAGLARVPDGFQYPSPNDWGCLKCGTANMASQKYCSNCRAERVTMEAS